MSRDIFNQIRLFRALSNLAWDVSRDGASTTSLGNLCQGLTTLCKKFQPKGSSMSTEDPSVGEVCWAGTTEALTSQKGMGKLEGEVWRGEK